MKFTMDSQRWKVFWERVPFLSFSTVFNKWFLPQELLDLVQSTDNEQQSYSILRGDVFITRTSETMDELGMSSVALKDYPHATYNGFTKRLRPINPERVLPEFIGYYLRTPVFRAGFTAFSTMTTRASLRNEDLLSMKVPVPDMQTQSTLPQFSLPTMIWLKTTKSRSSCWRKRRSGCIRSGLLTYAFPATKPRLSWMASRRGGKEWCCLK